MNFFFNEKTSRNVYWLSPDNTVPEGLKICKKPLVSTVIPMVSRLFYQEKHLDSQKQESEGRRVGLAADDEQQGS